MCGVVGCVMVGGVGVVGVGVVGVVGVGNVTMDISNVTSCVCK